MPVGRSDAGLVASGPIPAAAARDFLIGVAAGLASRRSRTWEGSNARRIDVPITRGAAPGSPRPNWRTVSPATS